MLAPYHRWGCLDYSFSHHTHKTLWSFLFISWRKKSQEQLCCCCFLRTKCPGCRATSRYLHTKKLSEQVLHLMLLTPQLPIPIETKFTMTGRAQFRRRNRFLQLLTIAAPPECANSLAC